jgi:hypothetical protein
MQHSLCRLGNFSACRFLAMAAMLLLVSCGGGDPAPPARPGSAREAAANVQGAPVYRFAKISTGAYFYTGNQWEADNIRDTLPDFRYEGIAFYQSDAASGSPVYRFANLDNGGYFYTASAWERDNTIANYPNMRYEGSTFSVAPAGDPAASPVYRVANLQNGAYLYTTNPAERDAAVALGFWRDEGSTFAARTSGSNGGGGGAPGDYLAFGVSQGPSQTRRFHLVDPTAPAPPRLSAPQNGTNYNGGGVYINHDNGLASTLIGTPLAFFIQSGQLYRVSLKRSDPTTPQRVSPLNNACGLPWIYGDLGIDRTTYWQEVALLGPTGQCDLSDASERVYVHQDDGPTTPPTRLPDKVRPLYQLTDESGRVIFIAAMDRRTATSRMVLLRPDLSVGPDVANSDHVEVPRRGFYIGHDSVRVMYFISSAGRLHRLDWTNAGATLSAPLHTFTSPDLQRGLVTGNDGVYIVDGRRIYRTTGGTPTLLAEVEAAAGTLAATNPHLTPSAIVLRYRGASPQRDTIVAIPRAGGNPVALFRSGALLNTTNVLGVHGERVIYWTNVLSPQQGYGELRSVLANGREAKVLSSRADFAHFLWNRYNDRRSMTIKGAYWCEIPGTQNDCRQGELRHLDLDTDTLKTLGRFNASTTLSSFGVLGYTLWADMPLVAGTFSTRYGSSNQYESWEDMWIAQPGQASSLTRVTTLTP